MNPPVVITPAEPHIAAAGQRRPQTVLNDMVDEWPGMPLETFAGYFLGLHSLYDAPAKLLAPSYADGFCTVPLYARGTFSVVLAVVYPHLPLATRQRTPSYDRFEVYVSGGIVFFRDGVRLFSSDNPPATWRGFPVAHTQSFGIESGPIGGAMLSFRKLRTRESEENQPQPNEGPENEIEDSNS